MAHDVYVSVQGMLTPDEAHRGMKPLQNFEKILSCDATIQEKSVFLHIMHPDA